MSIFPVTYICIYKYIYAIIIIIDIYNIMIIDKGSNFDVNIFIIE